MVANMNEIDEQYTSVFSGSHNILTPDERRLKRSKKRVSQTGAAEGHLPIRNSSATNNTISDSRFADLLVHNEDELLKFVAQINHVYQEKLKKPAPFMTFMLCGMQSAGKSTIMERFLNDVLNIVQEGTGTRCPLDTTCIHDDSCEDPICELYGSELGEGKEGECLSVDEVFERITEHNRRLGDEDRFSTESLRLVFRSKQVQNMRFVDTPGIISNRGVGQDNREQIKSILRSEMGKPNTKLCVLLEPKEFATNPIIDFCDETFGGRSAWINNATFLMTKFDKQLDDSRTGTKANNFFREFHANKCFPYLVMTPTLPMENLPPLELFKARKDLLDMSDRYEKERFTAWLDGQNRFKQENPADENMHEDAKIRIGFHQAKKVMREIMLEDTAKRLPEVLTEIRKELSLCNKELKTLREKQKFSDPNELKIIVGTVIYEIEKRIKDYLDGDLEAAIKFPERLQNLESELDDEDESEWSTKELNHHTDAENDWRNLIADLEEYPDVVQPNELFLGGKQIQRAIAFFRLVMIEALPDPFKLKKLVGNATGFVGGGLQRENWERAVVQVIRVSVKNVAHPGINFLIKHIGCIFRRLFCIALDDVKQGEELSMTFKLIPTAVEKHFLKEFDEMLWKLMHGAAEKTHTAVIPMYSKVNPNLPTLVLAPMREDNENASNPLYTMENGSYVVARSKKQSSEEAWLKSVKDRMTSIVSSSSDMVKNFMKNDSTTRARSKKQFLPEDRTSMVTEDEKDLILSRSFEYIVAVMELIVINLDFQLHYYLLDAFRVELERTFKTRLTSEVDWDKLIEPDPSLINRIRVVTDKIDGLTSSLQEVERLQRRL